MAFCGWTMPVLMEWILHGHDFKENNTLLKESTPIYYPIPTSVGRIARLNSL